MSSLRAYGLLVQLRTRLTLRGYLASKSALFGAILLLLVGIPISARVASQCHALLLTPQASAVLGWMLVGLFTLFALSPLLATAALPAGGGPAPLLRYPVSPRVLVAALATGALVEVTTLLALPVVGVFLQHTGGRGLSALALLLVAALLLGQTLLLLGGGLARQRRVRETLTLAVPFALALLLLFAARHPARAAVPSTARPAVLRAPPPALALTPPGLATTALVTHRALPLAGIVLWAALLLPLAGALARAQAGAEPDSTGGRTGLSPFRRVSRGTVAMMAAKEWTYYLREPGFRVALSRTGATLAAVGVVALYPTNAPGVGAVWDSTIGTGGVLLTLFWVLERACNLWGAESTAGNLLWSFPGPRWKWVLGKNLALFPLLLVLEAFFLGEYGLIVSAPLGVLLRYAGWGALWLGNLLALGNLVSARLPCPVLGEAAQQNAGQSFGTGMLYLAVATAAAYAVVLPLPLLWTLAAWAGSVAVAGRQLLQREAEIIAALEG